MTEVRRYWSHRSGHCEPLTGEFWTAFDTLLRRLIMETEPQYDVGGFFGVLAVPSEYGCDDEDLRTVIREKLGRDYYSPFDDYREAPKREPDVLDFIEVFYDLAAEPCKPTYTTEVNQLLARLNQPFELVAGEVHYRGSEVLDAPVEKLDGMTVRDEVLRGYLEHARDAFFDARQDRRLEGLRALYDAYERVKTLLDGDKKSSVSRTVEKLARHEELRPHFEQLFQSYTAIGNTANIRHSERDKVPLDDDPDLVEHLFYSGWALVRGVLAREAATPVS